MKAKLQGSKHLEDDLRVQFNEAVAEVSRLKKEAEKVIIKKNEEVNILKNTIKANKVDNKNCAVS